MDANREFQESVNRIQARQTISTAKVQEYSAMVALYDPGKLEKLRIETIVAMENFLDALEDHARIVKRLNSR